MKFDKQADTSKPQAVDAKTQWYMDNDPNFLLYVTSGKHYGVHVVGGLDNPTEFVPSITEDKPKPR